MDSFRGVLQRIARVPGTAVSRKLDNAAAWLFEKQHGTQVPAYFRCWPEAYTSLKVNFEEPYKEYTRKVSSPSAAISLELACFLYFMCDNIQPRLIVDLGSGFSSYVLRTFQQDQNIKVYSVDDNPFWLDRTRDFLSCHHLSIDNLYLWDQLPRFEGPPLSSLIVHDLGDSHKRVQILPHLLQLISTPAHVILDDMHKLLVRNCAMRWIRKHSLRYVNLSPYTRDDFGRFQWYVISG